MKTKTVPIDQIELGMKKGPGGDYFEHDLAALAGLIQDKRQQENPGCRVCFDYEYSRLKSDDIRHPAILVEGQSGYEPTTFDIGSTDQTARWNVDQANDALGLSKDDITAIIRSTMQ